MIKYRLLLLLWMVSVTNFAQNWKNDDQHSRLSFTTTHMLISDVSGVLKANLIILGIIALISYF
ncbi:hypothetical protein D3C85_114210 [compost metagenome]